MRRTLSSITLLLWLWSMISSSMADDPADDEDEHNQASYDIVALADSNHAAQSDATPYYYCMMRGLWRPDRHPQNFPPTLARMSNPLLYATDTDSFRPWQVGGNASVGMEQLAETGFTNALQSEILGAGREVLDYAEGMGFSVNPDDVTENYAFLPRITVSDKHPYLTAVSSLRPSPDWFTGFDLLSVVNEVRGTYYDRFVVQTYPLDAGTDDGTTYASPDQDANPHQDVSRIRVDNAPSSGALLSPDGSEVQSVAEWECVLHVCPAGVDDCEWYQQWPPANYCDIFLHPECNLPCDPLTSDACQACKPKAGDQGDVYYSDCCESNYEPLQGSCGSYDTSDLSTAMSEILYFCESTFSNIFAGSLDDIWNSAMECLWDYPSCFDVDTHLNDLYECFIDHSTEPTKCFESIVQCVEGLNPPDPFAGMPSCVIETSLELTQCFLDNMDACVPSCLSSWDGDFPFQVLNPLSLGTCAGLTNNVMNPMCRLVSCCEPCVAKLEDLSSCITSDVLSLACDSGCNADENKNDRHVASARIFIDKDTVHLSNDEDEHEGAMGVFADCVDEFSGGVAGWIQFATCVYQEILSIFQDDGSPILSPTMAPMLESPGTSEPWENCTECVLTGREWCHQITGSPWCGPVGSLGCDANTPPPIQDVTSCPEDGAIEPWQSERWDNCTSCVLTGREWCHEITGIPWCGPTGSLGCDVNTPTPVQDVASCPEDDADEPWQSEAWTNCTSCVLSGREWCSEITGIGWCGPINLLSCDVGAPPPVQDIGLCPAQDNDASQEPITESPTLSPTTFNATLTTESPTMSPTSVNATLSESPTNASSTITSNETESPTNAPFLSNTSQTQSPTGYPTVSTLPPSAVNDTAGAPQTFLFAALSIQLEGALGLTTASRRAFEETTEQFYRNAFLGSSVATRRRMQGTLFSSFDTIVQVKGESIDSASNTILYDQSVTFVSLDGTLDYGSTRDLILEPLEDEEQQETYVEMLQDSDPSFEMVTNAQSRSSIERSGAGDDDSNRLLIILLVVGGGLVCCCCGVAWLRQIKTGRIQSRESGESKGGIDMEDGGYMTPEGPLPQSPDYGFEGNADDYAKEEEEKEEEPYSDERFTFRASKEHHDDGNDMFTGEEEYEQEF